MFTVDLPARKPQCTSGDTSSTSVCNVFSTTWAKAFTTMLRSVYSTVVVAIAAVLYSVRQMLVACPQVLFPPPSTAIGAHGDGRGGWSSCQFANNRLL